jgi:hypothetical protein
MVRKTYAVLHWLAGVLCAAARRATVEATRSLECIVEIVEMKM